MADVNNPCLPSFYYHHKPIMWVLYRSRNVNHFQSRCAIMASKDDNVQHQLLYGRTRPCPVFDAGIVEGALFGLLVRNCIHWRDGLPCQFLVSFCFAATILFIKCFTKGTTMLPMHWHKYLGDFLPAVAATDRCRGCIPWIGDKIYLRACSPSLQGQRACKPGRKLGCVSAVCTVRVCRDRGWSRPKEVILQIQSLVTQEGDRVVIRHIHPWHVRPPISGSEQNDDCRDCEQYSFSHLIEWTDCYSSLHQRK